MNNKINLIIKTAKNGRLAIFIVIGFILSIVLGFSNYSYANAITGFNPENIIDDAIFTNSDSMNVSQIQAFLNSKVTSCDTNGILPAIEFGRGDLTHAQYAATRGWPGPPYTCLKDYTENSLSSAQIIYNVAHYHHINPQVLIVLLQKEQGLVTDTWPLPVQYRSATGYGCPDGAPCDSQYYGLTAQLHWAGTMFRTIVTNSQIWSNPYGSGTRWYTPYVLGNNYVQWSPNASCGGSIINISTRATQALYNYTPYRPNQASLNAGYGLGDSCSSYGNRNFYLYFTDWFGSTHFSQPIGAFLYYQQSTGVIYLVSDSVRYHIPDWDTMINYGLNHYPVQTVSDETIQNLTDGGMLSSLIYDDNGVYLVNNGFRHPVSQEMCTVWSFDCMNGSIVKRLGSSFQTQYLQLGGVLPPLLKQGAYIYKISNEQKQPIANPKTLADLGYSNTPALVASAVNSRQSLGPLLITTPGVIQFSPNPHIYYFDGINYFIVGDMGAYYDWSLQKSTYLVVPVSSYNQTPPSATTLNSWAILDNQKYIVDQGRKLLVTSAIDNIWPELQYSAPPSTLFDSLPSDNMSQLVLATPYVYLLDAGEKHYVQTIDEYLSLLGEYGKVTSIRLNKVSTIPQGNDALVDGSLIIVQDGSGIIYVVNNNKLTHISSPEVFNAYGYKWGAVRVYSTAIMDDYISDGKILINGIASDGTHYIVSGSTLYQLSSALAQEFGAIDERFTPISKQSIKSSAPSLPRFLLNTDNGRVYYATGGSIHYLSSYQSFKLYGGEYTPRVPVNTYVIESFSEGQTL